VLLDSLGRQTFRADFELRPLAPNRLASGVRPNPIRDRLQAPEGQGVSSIKEALASRPSLGQDLYHGWGMRGNLGRSCYMTK
jgi:hypothetical protein